MILAHPNIFRQGYCSLAFHPTFCYPLPEFVILSVSEGSRTPAILRTTALHTSPCHPTPPSHPSPGIVILSVSEGSRSPVTLATLAPPGTHEGIESNLIYQEHDENVSEKEYACLSS